MGVQKLSKRRQKWVLSAFMFALGSICTMAIFGVVSVMRAGNQGPRDKEISHVSDVSAMSIKSKSFDHNIQKKLHRNKLLMNSTNDGKPVRILCFVKTYPKNHRTRAKTIKETWGRRCDKLLFMSTRKDNSLPTIALFAPHVNESRKLLTEKVFRALKHVYMHYLDEYDWFHEADDDTYIIVNNLRGFLSTKDPTKPVYYGHRFMKYVPQGYTSGGAGYVMSREALRRIRDIGPKERLCNTKGTASDVHVGHCLNAVGVKLGLSVDSKGRSRYHCMDIESFIFGGFPGWYKNFTAPGDGFKTNWIADYPISFHYVSEGKMRTLEFLIYGTRVHGQSRLPKKPFD